MTDITKPRDIAHALELCPYRTIFGLPIGGVLDVSHCDFIAIVDIAHCPLTRQMMRRARRALMSGKPVVLMANTSEWRDHARAELTAFLGPVMAEQSDVVH